jgi:hypothetical protein
MPYYTYKCWDLIRAVATAKNISQVTCGQMRDRLKRMDVEAARNDFRIRTLASLDGNFARLIYLASLRNLNTGEFCHQGLANTFSPSVAASALNACHREVFESLAVCPLKSLVEELERYLQGPSGNAETTLVAWETHEPYRVIVPSPCDETKVSLFLANVKTALAMLKSRHSPALEKPEAASRLRLLHR